MGKLIWHYMKEFKGQYLVVLVALLIDNFSILIPPRVVQFLTDAIATQTLTQDMLFWQLVFLFATTFVMYGASYVWQLLLFKNMVRFEFRIRRQSFAKLIRMRTPFYDKFRSGDMMTRFTSDVDMFKDLLGYGAMTVVFSVAAVALVLFNMLSISPSMTLVSLIPISLLSVIVFFVGRAQDVMVEESREAVAQLSDEVLEVVEGVRVTRAYGKHDAKAATFHKKTASLRKKADRIMTYQAVYVPTFTILIAVSVALVMWLGADGLRQGTVTIGQIVAFQLYIYTLIEPAWMIADFILVYQTARTSFGKINELITASDEMEVDGREAAKDFEVLELRDYHFRYAGSERDQLDGVSVSLSSGQTLGIVGKTGSGKTTFVRQLLRQYPVGSGDFLLNGRPITDYQRQTVEQLIGYVPQEHVLFSTTVAENIRVGNRHATEEEIWQAIDTASFTKDVTRMTKGLDTVVGERGLSISGGQKQRIAIARAMIKNPEVLILDDSLSAVDAKTERAIIANIQQHRAGQTNVIVAHRLSAVQHADWIIVLDEGRIVEEGTAASLIAAGGWYFEQFERQQLEEGGEAHAMEATESSVLG